MSCRIDSLPGDIQREVFHHLDGQTLAKTLAPVNAKAQAFLDQPTSHPDIVGLRLSLGRFNITHFQAILPRSSVLGFIMMIAVSIGTGMFIAVQIIMLPLIALVITIVALAALGLSLYHGTKTFIETRVL